MVKNLWKRIILVCGNRHEEEVQMSLIKGPSSLFYACPKYYPENRNANERACANRLSLEDYEKMLDNLSQRIEKSILAGNKISLAGYKWKYKTIEFEVISHSDECIKVRMLNKKALK